MPALFLSSLGPGPVQQVLLKAQRTVTTNPPINFSQPLNDFKPTYCTVQLQTGLENELVVKLRSGPGPGLVQFTAQLKFFRA